MTITFSGGVGLELDKHRFNVSKLPTLPKFSHKGKTSAVFISLLIILILAVVFIAVVGYVIWKKMFEEVEESWEKEYSAYRLSYKDLYRATKGFRESDLLGSGGFGKVYKGILPTNHSEVAIKKISHDSRQGMREFVSEIVSMRRLRHRNLVQLLGYCRRKGELLLVYDCITGKPTTATDVFAFGTFVPEVACGRRPLGLHNTDRDDFLLVDWVYESLKRGGVHETSDPKLEGRYVHREMELVLKLGLHCSHPNSEARPSMRQVVQFLRFEADLPDVPADYELERGDLLDERWGVSTSAVSSSSFKVSAGIFFSDNLSAGIFFSDNSVVHSGR